MKILKYSEVKPTRFESKEAKTGNNDLIGLSRIGKEV
jgi:hypothetical protein